MAAFFLKLKTSQDMVRYLQLEGKDQEQGEEDQVGGSLLMFHGEENTKVTEAVFNISNHYTPCYYEDYQFCSVKSHVGRVSCKKS